jgi:hypothetical protein
MLLRQMLSKQYFFTGNINEINKKKQNQSNEMADINLLKNTLYSEKNIFKKYPGVRIYVKFIPGN